MILTNEDLLAISQVFDERFDKKLDERLKPIEEDIRELKNDVAVLKTDVAALKTSLHNVTLLLENDVLPRLNTIESCYLDTYRRYQKNNDKMEKTFDDVDLLKKVVTDHSVKLQKLALA